MDKEDELIPANAHEPFVKDQQLLKTGYEKLLWPAPLLTSVPLAAKGKNFESTTALAGQITGYTTAETKARESFRESVQEAMKVAEERSTFNGHRRLPEDLDTANQEQDRKALKERQKDWQEEKATYGRAGKGAFEFNNTLFPEK